MRPAIECEPLLTLKTHRQKVRQVRPLVKRHLAKIKQEIEVREEIPTVSPRPCLKAAA
jgi:hypothetical protein